ncbi:GtrA family protein [Limnobacter parvus]|uniref:GtrA family protein n=1 Tax=Limnobacter parvus TaxID=2939690 RepID=UPI00353039E6
MVGSNFPKFALVGVFNTLIHFLILAFSTRHLGADQLFGNVAGYLCASTLSFFINSTWVFRKELSFMRFIRFHKVGALGLFVSATVGFLADSYRLHYGVTMLVSIVALPVASYLLHRRFTFK